MPGKPQRGSSEGGRGRQVPSTGAKPRFSRPKKVAPPAPRLTANQDRVVALRRNKQEALDHAKGMAERMGVKPVERKVEDAEGLERLHVRIAHSGLCSRRAAEKLILEARVTVNGDIVAELGFKVAPDDDVRVDGQPIRAAKHYTVILNKPAGIVTTLSDPQGRPTVVKYLPDYGVQLKPVGRLDMDTEGLLLVTNDGELANRLAHPRYGVEKEYQAIVKGIPNDEALERLRTGVFVEGRKTAPAKVEVIHAEAKTQTTGLRITIHEGRKRQVRLMGDAIGHPVMSLKRIRYGPLRVKGMRVGEARLLGKKEVDDLRKLVGLEPE
jgi:23S rRNA pseudouridine2605 synthase